MKGLLYREFYITRKTCFLMYGLTLLFITFSFLVLLSMKYGNLRNTEFVETDIRTMFVYAISMMSVITVEAAFQAIYSDYAVNWMKYSYCQPIAPIKAVGVRYLYGLLLIGVSAIYSFGYTGILCVATDYVLLTGMIKNMVLIIMVGVLLVAVDIPLALYFKTASAVGKIMILPLVIIYATVGVYSISNTSKMSSEEASVYLENMLQKCVDIRDMIFPFLPLILILLAGVSLFLSIKIYQRREKV